MTINELKQAISNEKPRSAWGRGVKDYAHELVDNIAGSISSNCSLDADLPARGELKAAMLNGADSWNQYSWGGCSCIYNADIAETLCSPSELKKTRNGERRPNSREEWLDVQARALSQAANMIMRLARA